MIVALGFAIIEIATAAVPEVKKVSPGKNKKGPDKNVVLSADPDASKVEYFEKNWVRLIKSKNKFFKNVFFIFLG